MTAATPTPARWQADRSAELRALLAQRILILDGAMGTMVQRHGLVEADYRVGVTNSRFAAHGWRVLPFAASSLDDDPEAFVALVRRAVGQ